MKPIADIRLYRCERYDAQTPPATLPIADKPLSAAVKRIVMKLRERRFSLGEFDHLYCIFTAAPLPSEFFLSDRTDREHKWYRHCFIRVGEELYGRLGSPAARGETLGLIGTALVTLFATEHFDAAAITSCLTEALEQGEAMRMKFKEKRTETRIATIYLRYLDTCLFSPLLQVRDAQGSVLLEKDLPAMPTLDALGSLSLSSHKVTIRPRKNAFTAHMPPIVVEY